MNTNFHPLTKRIHFMWASHGIIPAMLSSFNPMYRFDMILKIIFGIILILQFPIAICTWFCTNKLLGQSRLISSWTISSLTINTSIIKKAFNWFCIFILVNAFTVRAYGQKTDTGFTYAYQSHNNTKLFQSKSLKSFTENSPFNEVSTKAVRHFTKNFAQAENVRWYKEGSKVVAYFSLNNIKTKAAYNQKGHWLYSVRTYEQSSLPKNIREKIRCTFYDFTISSVNEITTNSEFSYKVQIENESFVKIIQIFDDEITIIKEFVKTR